MAKNSKRGKRVSTVLTILSSDFNKHTEGISDKEIVDTVTDAWKADNAAWWTTAGLVNVQYMAELSKLKKNADGSYDVPNNDLRPLEARVAMSIGDGEVVSAEDVAELAIMDKVFPTNFGRNRAPFEAYRYALRKCSNDMGGIDNVTCANLKAAIDEYVASGIAENAAHTAPDVEARAVKCVEEMSKVLEDLKESDFINKASYNDLDNFYKATCRITNVCQAMSASVVAVEKK